MRLPPAPIGSLLAATAFAAGCALAPALTFAPVGPIAALVAAGTALGRRCGIAMAWLGLGLLRALGEPGAAAAVRADQPVFAVVRVIGAWSAPAQGFGATARAELRSVRQGGSVDVVRRRLWLDWEPETVPPPTGSVLRVRGVISRPHGYANRVVVRGGEARLRIKSQRLVEILAGPGPTARLGSALQREVSRVWPADDPAPSVALARALLLGDTQRFSDAWRRGFRRSGLAHLLAVSGFNVSLVIGGALLLAAPLARTLRFTLTIVLAATYVLLVGPQSPVLRAGMMALLAGAALLARRPPAATHTLALAGLAALASEPERVFDLSFQLTMVASAALLIAAPALAGRWTAVQPMTALLLAAPVAVQWATLPWAIGRFHQVQLLSALYNLVATPWVVFTTAWVMAGTAVGLAAPVAVPWVRSVMTWMAEPIDWLSTPGFCIGVTPVEGFTVPVVVSVALVTVAVWWPRRYGPRLAALIALALYGLASGGGSAPGGRAERLSWTAFDVGQGDATLLRGGGAVILIDGGGQSRGDFAARVLVPALAGERVAAIDVAVVSHADRDHCGGLADLADYLPIREVWTGPGWEAAECTRRLVSEIGARTAVLVAGDVRQRGAWRFEVLGPDLEVYAGGGSGNASSLVLRASAGGRSLLLTGDVEAAGELALVARQRDALQVDWLKLAHHGSASSSTPPFLRAAAPRFAWISAGRGNAFGHPAAKVLERLDSLGVRALRTDRHGQIHVHWRQGEPARLELPRTPATAYDRN